MQEVFFACGRKNTVLPRDKMQGQLHSKTANERVKKFRRRKKRLVAKIGLAALSRLATSLKEPSQRQWWKMFSTSGGTCNAEARPGREVVGQV